MAVASISEYSASINTPQMIKAKMLMGGSPIKKNGRQIKYSGGFCVVFPFETSTKKYAVRCWHTNVNDIQNRTKLISDTIKTISLPYFVGFEYVPNGIHTSQGAQDIVVMEWVNAKTLKKYIADNIYQPSKILDLANSFKNMVSDLHSHHLAHGDLQHGNILVKEDGSIRLVDYDSMYVPALSGYSDDIKGLAGYQHPSRWNNKKISETIDYFSELIIYTSLLALSKIPNLWYDLNIENTETLIFTAEDILSKGKSKIFQILDNNYDLQPLSIKIKEFIDKDCLDDLKPLEVVVIDQQKAIVDNIAEKWGNNGYKKKIQTQKDYSEMANDISERW